MYKVKSIENYICSCMMYEQEKVFLTRFFAKLYFAKMCKKCDMVFIEEKFGDEWQQISFYKRKPW